MSLRRHRDFRTLWLAVTVSEVGSQLSGVALPLLVISVLHASTFAVGLLTACETVAFLVVGLPAGAWVDRVRRRPVLVAADAGRAALLLSVPVAWWLGVLTLAQVYVVALVTGVATVFFDVAYQSSLPDLVGRPALVEANARLEVSASSAAIGGPALAGVIVQALAAPAAILGDALSFVASALLLRRITRTEPPPAPPQHQRLRAQVREGLAFVIGHPVLRAIAACTGWVNLTASAAGALLVLFLVRTLQLTPGVVGLLLSAASVGGVVGAATPRAAPRRGGSARHVWLAPMLSLPFGLLVPLADRGARLLLLVVSQLVVSVGLVHYNVAQVSLRQTLTPDRLLGRMNASMRFLVWGPRPLGALAGGLLGSTLGIRPTLWLSAAAMQLGVVPVLLSPLRSDGPGILAGCASRQRPTTPSGRWSRWRRRGRTATS